MKRWWIETLVLVAVLTGPVRTQAQALFGEWLLNDGAGTVAADSSGYGLDAAVVGTAVWGSDYFTFDGSNYLYVSREAQGFHLDFTRSFRITMEIRTTQTNVGTLMSRHNGSWVPGAKNLYINGGTVHCGAGYIFDIGGSLPVANGSWHEVTMEYDADTQVVSLYVDGFFDTSTIADLSTYGDDFDLYFGVQNAYANFVGDMRNVRIYQYPTQAYNPSPANGDLNVDASVNQITWQSPDPSYLFDVFFGTDQTLVAARDPSMQIGDNQADTFAAVSLAVGNDYYWVVDIVDPNVIPGDLWHFATRSYAASEPDPADGESLVSIYKTLTWTPGIGATGHEVYFSENLDEVEGMTIAPVSTVTAAYDPGTLKLGYTYYWRVVETGGPSGDVVGPVWTFSATPDEVIEDFQYFSDTELQNAWVGVPQENFRSPNYGHISMAVPYRTYTQAYTRTFDSALDFSTAARITFEYRHDRDAGTAAAITLKLLDQNDNVLISSTVTDPVLHEFTEWEVPLWGQGVDLRAVKKITFQFTSVPGPVEPETIFIDNLVLRLARCTEPIPGDANGDCQVDLTDLALIASSWLQCNRFPAEACFSF